jgi:hypothetical protein
VTRAPALFSGVATGVGTVFKLFGLCALLIAAMFAYIVVSVLRRAAWLEGTTVRMRRALITKRVDLATATVTGDAVTYRPSNANPNYSTVYLAPTLAARDPGSGVGGSRFHCAAWASSGYRPTN